MKTKVFVFRFVSICGASLALARSPVNLRFGLITILNHQLGWARGMET